MFCRQGVALQLEKALPRRSVWRFPKVAKVLWQPEGSQAASEWCSCLCVKVHNLHLYQPVLHRTGKVTDGFMCTTSGHAHTSYVDATHETQILPMSSWPTQVYSEAKGHPGWDDFCCLQVAGFPSRLCHQPARDGVRRWAGGSRGFEVTSW